MMHMRFDPSPTSWRSASTGEESPDGGSRVRSHIPSQRDVLPLRAAAGSATPITIEVRALLQPSLRNAATHTLMAMHEGASLEHAVGTAREDLCCACAIARAHDVRAEQVIVLLKEEWRALPESHVHSPAEGELVLARVVTICILAYYASNGT